MSLRKVALLLLVTQVLASAGTPALASESSPPPAVLQAIQRLRPQVRLLEGGTLTVPAFGRWVIGGKSCTAAAGMAPPTCAQSSLAPGLAFSGLDGEPASAVPGPAFGGPPTAEDAAWIVAPHASRPDLVAHRIYLSRTRWIGEKRWDFVQLGTDCPEGVGVGLGTRGGACGIVLVFEVRGARFGLRIDEATVRAAAEGPLRPWTQADGQIDELLLGGMAAVLLGHTKLGLAKYMLPALSAVPKEHPWYLDLVTTCCEAALPLQGAEQLLRLVGELRSSTPELPGLSLIEAGLLAQVGKIDDAITLARAGFEDPATEWSARCAYLRIRREFGRPSDGWRSEVLPLPSTKCPPGWLSTLAEEFALYGEARLAHRLLDAVQGTRPLEPRDYFTRGTAYYLDGRHPDAQVALETALGYKEAPREWHGVLADVYLAQRQYLAAVRSYDIAIGNNPPQGETFGHVLRRAFARGMSGDAVGALGDVRACIDAQPDSVDAWRVLWRLGRHLKDPGSVTRAERELGRLDPRALEELRTRKGDD